MTGEAVPRSVAAVPQDGTIFVPRTAAAFFPQSEPVLHRSRALPLRNLSAISSGREPVQAQPRTGWEVRHESVRRHSTSRGPANSARTALRERKPPSQSHGSRPSRRASPGHVWPTAGRAAVIPPSGPRPTTRSEFTRVVAQNTVRVEATRKPHEGLQRGLQSPGMWRQGCWATTLLHAFRVLQYWTDCRVI